MAVTGTREATAIIASSALRTGRCRQASGVRNRSVWKDRVQNMCGIAGVVSATRESNVTEVLVRQMCDQIVHRGPDDEGIYVADGAGLGMRRLSIIDLAGEHQPVFNEDRSAWIVFNGEI